MKKISLLAIWLLAGCAAVHQSVESDTLAPRRAVTRLGMLNSIEIPATYRRTNDAPGMIWVLWSNESLCIVDPSVWFRTRVRDRVSCNWRSPR
jgi:hypothetical protein